MHKLQAAAAAMAEGILSEADIDAALVNTLRIRFRTGQFDGPGATPWSGLGASVINSAEHKALAKEAAHKGGWGALFKMCKGGGRFSCQQR